MLSTQVAKLVAEIFAEMTFLFGDVHCDPHQVPMRLCVSCVTALPSHLCGLLQYSEVISSF